MAACCTCPSAGGIGDSIRIKVIAPAIRTLSGEYVKPSASPANGDRHIVSAAATGVWAGKTNQIAVRIADAWEYQVPKIGWLCFIEDEAKLSAYKPTGWSAGIAI